MNFPALEKLHENYRSEAQNWLSNTEIPEDVLIGSHEQKIEFAVASVRHERKFSDPEKCELAYHRGEALLGPEVDEVVTGNFSKEIMPYYIGQREVKFDSLENEISSQITTAFWLHVLERESIRDLYENIRYTDRDIKLNEHLQPFLDAGEVGPLTDVLLGYAARSDGKKNVPQRPKAMAGVTASLLSKILGRRDISGADLMILMGQGEVKPRTLIQTDFYLDYALETLSENDLAKVKEKVHQALPQNHVFWKIKDKLSDAEIFNTVHRHDVYDYKLKSWVAGTAAFKEITGRDLPIREAIAMNPSRYFHLSHTEAYMELLDENGPESPKRYLRPKLIWEKLLYDKDEEMFITTFTIDTPSIYHELVQNVLNQCSLNIPQIGSSRTGADFIEYELSFETHREYLKEKKGIELDFLKMFKMSMENTPVPGDTVRLSVEENLDDDEIDELGAPGFRVGDTGRVTAILPMNGGYGYKIEGIYHYFGNDELQVLLRPSLKKQPENASELG